MVIWWPTTAMPRRPECYYLKANHKLTTLISWLCVPPGLHKVKKGRGDLSHLVLRAGTDLPCCLSTGNKSDHKQLVLRLCSSLLCSKPGEGLPQKRGTSLPVPPAACLFIIAILQVRINSQLQQNLPLLPKQRLSPRAAGRTPGCAVAFHPCLLSGCGCRARRTGKVSRVAFPREAKPDLLLQLPRGPGCSEGERGAGRARCQQAGRAGRVPRGGVSHGCRWRRAQGMPRQVHGGQTHSRRNPAG